MVVAIEKIGGSLKDSLSKVLGQIPLPDLAQKTVLLKPNMGRIAHDKSGVVTSASVIRAVIEYFLERGVKDILLGDSPITGVKSLEAFARVGITPESLPRDVRLVDFDRDEPFTMDIPHGRLIKSMKVCAPVSKADYLVSIPVMKTHMHTVVSLGLKNMKGCLFKKEKVKFHKLDGGDSEEKTLDTALSDLATILLPDLTIIDGTYGMEGFGPSSGEVIEPGVVVAGDNCISTDAVGAVLMGFSPRDIPSLYLSSERGLGEIDSSKIEVIPEDYQHLITKFKPAPVSFDIEYEGIYVYDSGACSGCMSTVLLLLKRYEEEIRELFNQEKITIVIGDKNDKHEGDNVILIGKCTGKHKEKGIFIPGCPPVASAILERLVAEKQKTENK